METCFRPHWDDVYKLWVLLKGEAWTEGRAAETSCWWSPVDLSQQRGCAVNDCSQGSVSHQRRWKFMPPTCVLQSQIPSFEFFFWKSQSYYTFERGKALVLYRKCFVILLSKMAHNIRVFPPTPTCSIPVLFDFHSSSHSLQRQTTETVSVVVISSPSLKSYPGVRPLPLSLRHCHWNLFDCFWKPALTWKQLPKL